MKRSMILILIMFIVGVPTNILAQRGCCSHHGGVAGCNSNGRQICNDGSLSPSCTCTPTVQNIYGCTDKDAKNYNSSANKDDGSCEYTVVTPNDIETSDNKIENTVSEVEVVETDTEEESSDGAAAFAIVGGALVTYLYRKRKK